jgi:hypothetical protein
LLRKAWQQFIHRDMIAPGLGLPDTRSRSHVDDHGPPSLTRHQLTAPRVVSHAYQNAHEQYVPTSARCFCAMRLMQPIKVGVVIRKAVNRGPLPGFGRA